MDNIEPVKAKMLRQYVKKSLTEWMEMTPILNLKEMGNTSILGTYLYKSVTTSLRFS